MESAFQFTNPVLTGIEFFINEGFLSESKAEIQIDMKLSVQVSKCEGKNEAQVGLTVELGEHSDKMPFWIKAVEKANFRWEKDIDEQLADNLLNQNAPSLLLSYLRPIIVQITSASVIGAYSIPFVNFTKE